MPLAIDLFCGLFGWAEGLTAEGWSVVGFDLEDMRGKLGLAPLPNTSLVLQDVLTLHGAQFRDADLIVASPPCQFFSYCAMPWTRAKALADDVRADPAKRERETALFCACFRIQREACEAAGRHIPLIVENVRGAQPWVGRARWSFGSYYLWGNVPALMPDTRSFKSQGMNWSDRSKRGQDFTRVAGNQAIKNSGGKGIPYHPPGRWTDPTERGIKITGCWFWENDHPLRQYHYERRKVASALIAKIPLPLAAYIGRVFYPRAVAA